MLPEGERTMNNDIMSDLTDAVDRLRYAFTKHGMAEPSTITLATTDDYEVLRSVHTLAGYNGNGELPDGVACRIGGIEIVRPSA